MAKPTGRPVREEVVTTATALIQRVGVSSFSYSDIAKELEIKPPSIHHHFKTKEDLVTEVVRQYRAHFNGEVDKIEAPTVNGRLAGYGDLFSQTASTGQLCLCGAVAGEWMTVGEKPKAEVHGFFDDQLSWLTNQLSTGIENGELRADLNPSLTAQLFLSALEGSLFLARTRENPDFSSTIGRLLSELIDR